MKRLLMILMLLSFATGTATADNAAPTSDLHLIRTTPAEKEVWYSNLVTKAILFYGSACDSGESQACFNLGMIYDTGDMTVQDKTKAAQAYRLGCSKGSAAACNNLGVLYGTGDGMKADLPLASGYFDQACQLKEEIACTNQKMLSDRLIAR